LFAGASSIPGIQVATLVMGFLVISCGVAILYSFNLRALPKTMHDLFHPSDEESGEDLLDMEEEEEEKEKEMEFSPGTATGVALAVDTMGRRASVPAKDSVSSPLSPAGTLAEPHAATEAVQMPLEAAASSSVGTITAPADGSGTVGRSGTQLSGDRSTSLSRPGIAFTPSSPSDAPPPPLKHGRKVSVSGQSTRALTRKNTVAFALDVLTSHAWELDSAALEKYSTGIAPQAQSGSLRRKHPRGYSAESLNTEGVDLNVLGNGTASSAADSAQTDEVPVIRRQDTGESIVFIESAGDSAPTPGLVLEDVGTNRQALGSMVEEPETER